MAEIRETFSWAPPVFEVNLSGVYLSRVDLGGVDLCVSNLSSAYFWKANLSRAYFWRANLNGINLSKANLTEANFAGTSISESVFGDVDLSTVKGLDTIQHYRPSTIGIDTIIRSQGKIPEISFVVLASLTLLLR